MPPPDAGGVSSAVVTVRGQSDAKHGNQPSYAVVYLNELASESYSDQNRPKFRIGSIIVREKLPEPDAKQPELLTVMIKREPGFNPKGGDWLFLTLAGDGSRVTERTKTGACLECHQSARNDDFVFRIR